MWSEEAAWIAIPLTLVLGAIALVLIFLKYSGVFHEIVISTGRPPLGEVVYMYKMARGEYGQSGHMFTAAHTLMPEYRCMGVYYDDPQQRPAESLRYLVGSIISEGGAPPNPEHEQIFKEAGYSKAVFPSVQNAVYTSFPFLGAHTTLVGVFRVYPALREYTRERSLCAHPMLEVYDGPKALMHFIGPLEQQTAFHVPELEEAERGEDPAASDTDFPLTDDENREETNSWDKSASIVQKDEVASESEPKTHEPAAAPKDLNSGSADESETNTVSSFEELHLSDAAPELPTDSPSTTDEEQITTSSDDAASSTDQKPLCPQLPSGEEVKSD